MLKRSKILVAFLVVTVLCASIGFAAISDTITVSGGIAVEADNFTDDLDADIYFTGITKSVTGSAVESGVTIPEASTFSGNNVDSISFTINNTALTTQNDTITLVATIANANTAQKVKVTSAFADNFTGKIGTTATTDCISVTQTLSANEIAAATDASTLGTVTLTIVISLDKIPDVDIDSTTVTVNVTAEPIS